jgi:hypothetical protein
MDRTLTIASIALALYLIYFLIHFMLHPIKFRKARKIGCWTFDIVVLAIVSTVAVVVSFTDW